MLQHIAETCMSVDHGVPPTADSSARNIQPRGWLTRCREEIKGCVRMANQDQNQGGQQNQQGGQGGQQGGQNQPGQK